MEEGTAPARNLSPWNWRQERRELRREAIEAGEMGCEGRWGVVMEQYLFADAHCHLESCAGLPDPKVLHISCGHSQEANAKNARIAPQYANVYFCAGIAPQEAQKHKDAKILLVGWEEEIASFAGARDAVGAGGASGTGIGGEMPGGNGRASADGKLVAIGEIGLDYKWAATEEEKHLQMECFVSQLQLAERMGLPVVVHSRDAENECIEVLQSFNIPYMMHCFSGSREAALKACEGRGIISIPPLRNKERKQFIRDLPIEKLVAETDAPYIGKTPADAAESIKMIAEIKGMEEAAVQKQTLLNTVSFFRIK